jgi:hypothetical protein
MEKWKPMIGFEGLYEVSNKGYIRSIPRNGTQRHGRVLSRNKDMDGYLVCKVRNKDKVKTVKIHREVAKAFLPNPETKPQVNHKNGNKADCELSNLEWVTHSENIFHAKLNGLQMECPNRVSVNQIARDGNLVATYESLKQAEEKTSIHWTGISAVLRGVRKSAGGYTWERVTTSRKA